MINKLENAFPADNAVSAVVGNRNSLWILLKIQVWRFVKWFERR